MSDLTVYHKLIDTLASANRSCSVGPFGARQPVGYEEFCPSRCEAPENSSTRRLSRLFWPRKREQREDGSSLTTS